MRYLRIPLVFVRKKNNNRNQGVRRLPYIT
nr:MAG TPA: hypothetical protein [Caudoviricetes sp.]